MPELPEVETTVRGLRPHVVGETIAKVQMHCQRLRYPLPDLSTLLQNKHIHSLERRGKYILVGVDVGHLIIHLGMSGSLRLDNEAGSLKKPHDHIEILFVNGQRLRYHDPRRFGCWLWTVDDPESHSLLTALGPEPLANTFSGHYLHEQLKHRQTPIKSAIMDQKTVVGIGNIYATEALFLTKINPWTPAQKLSLQSCQALVQTSKNLLRQAIQRGGTTLKDFVNGSGKPGYFKQQLMVYGRGGKACLICQTPLTTARIGQRSTVFCDVCQPFVKD